MFRTSFVLCLAAVCSASCSGSIEGPKLCIFRPSDAQDPNTVSRDACGAMPRPAVSAGDAIFVLYATSDKAEIDDPVTITISTPCGSVAAQHTVAEHKVLVATVAPPGADCSFEVTASLLNETNHVSSLQNATKCSGLDLVCKGSADAGVAEAGAAGASN
jgi:hypothetical protein